MSRKKQKVTGSKKKKKTFRWWLWLLSFVFIYLIIIFLWVFDPVLAFVYDVLTLQSEVESKEQVEDVLARLEHISYEQATQTLFGKETAIGNQDYRYIFEHREFAKIKWFERYRFIVGKVRLKDFLSNDRIFKKYQIPNLNKVQYLVIEKQLLFKILELHQALKEQNLSTHAIKVTSGFRDPTHNERVKGKSNSRHLFGDAVDISVGDVNADGKRNREDVRLVYRLLDKEIIGGQGGVGIYKNAPFLIHFDLRGRGARW